jgi:hypothetical protein
MKALRKTVEGEGHIELCEVPVSEIGPGEVLMKAWEEWETVFDNLRAKQDVKALIHPNGRDWAD